MPIVLPLSSVRRARLWLGEDPAVQPLDGQRTTRSFPAPFESVHAAYSVTVEVMIPRGPRSLYGLLGLFLTPTDDGACQLLVPEGGSDSNVEGTLDLLGLRSDRYAAGLPMEYTGAVFEAAAALGAAGELPPGLAEVRWAVHGEASSSAPMFRYLTSIALRLAAIRPSNPLAPRVLAMFDEPLR